MLRCAITDGRASGFVNNAQIDRLQDQVQRWAADSIDIIQLREKHLEAGALLTLADVALRAIQDTNSSTKLLINGRADVAIAARAHGVHLTAHPDELTPQQIRSLYAHVRLAPPVISISCHTPEEVIRARDCGVDYILFGPIFEKRVDGEVVTEGVGIEALRQACSLAESIPVLALGGITAENSGACLEAGAAGIAGIRTFL